MKLMNRANKGDIVISSSATLGKVAKVDNKTVGCIVYTGLIRFKPYSGLYDDYLIQYFSSNDFMRQINKSKTGAAIKHFGPTHLKQMILPLPPMSEQKRIVAKVDELMSLCDQLEEQINESKDNADLLMQAVLKEAFEA